jgi:hypothetical protein
VTEAIERSRERFKASGGYKVLVVGSPHSASTRDVWMGVMKGLSANGIGVQSYDVLPRTSLFENFLEWVKEKSIPTPYLKGIPAPNVLAYEPVFGAAHWFEVDAVFFISPQYTPLEVPAMLKKDGFKVWGYFTECPYEDHIDAAQKAERFSACFLNDRNSVATWRSFNPASHYLPHSYDPEKHFPWWDAPETRRRRTDPRNGHEHVTYVGSGFSRRQRYLEAVDWTGIDLRIYGYWPLIRPLEDEKKQEYFEKVAPNRESPLLPFLRDTLVENAMTARIYRGSAIGVNLHRTERWNNNSDVLIDEGEAYSMGPRAVELAACGTFQISDYREEIRDVFGDTVPIHKSPADLGTLIRKYLDDPVRRSELAVQQREAIKERTFANHMRRVLELAA